MISTGGVWVRQYSSMRQICLILTWLIVTLDTSLRQSVKLDIPGEDYFLTTFEEHDVEAVQEIMAFDSVNNNLIAVPKP